ncbi:MAG: hypothetical protein QOC98_146 [Frankiaceae bacterium]|nr:hypothetical protein [Frankiaceae bacterium]
MLVESDDRPPAGRATPRRSRPVVDPPAGDLSATLLDPSSRRATSTPSKGRLPRWVVRALGLYLASRVLVWLAGLMAVGIAPPARASNWFERWDSFWYLEIARHGYPSVIEPLSQDRPYSPLAFFPLWPLLVRGTGNLIGGHPTIAAYLLNFLLAGVLALLVRMVFARVTDDRTADVAVLLYVFFPGTNVFSAAYSEPLALCLAAGTLLALLHQRWWVAGILAALAGATRPPIAMAVFAALAWVVLAAVARPATGEDGLRRLRPLIAPLLAPLGLVAFAVYGWRHTGHPLAWREAEQLFGNHIDFGRSFATDVSGAIAENVRAPATGLAVLVWISVAILLVLAVFFVLRLPPAMLVVYTVVSLVVPATTSALMPKVRFLAAAFPLILPLAGWLRERGRETLLGVVVGVEASLLVGFTMMHLLATLAFP